MPFFCHTILTENNPRIVVLALAKAGTWTNDVYSLQTLLCSSWSRANPAGFQDVVPLLLETCCFPVVLPGDASCSGMLKLV